jgi:hypothetical protein
MAFGDEDLDAIFSSSDPFAVQAIFTTVVGPPATTVTVYGQFTDASEGVQLFGVETQAAQPSFTCRTSEVTSVKPKMKVTISAVVYTVEKIEKVGTGVSVVWLKT